MKRLGLVLWGLFLLLNASLFSAQSSALLNGTFTVNTANGQTDFKFKLPDYKIEKFQEFSKVKIDGAELTIKEGAPELPFFTVSIAVPQNSSPLLQKATVLNQELVKNIKVFPAQAVNSEDKSFKYDTDFYKNETSYPQNSIQISNIQTLRDFNIISVNVYPFVYNPKNNELQIKKDISFTISHSSKNINDIYQNNAMISREFEPLYKTLIANYEQIRSDFPVYSKPHILIIYPNTTDTNFLSSLNSLVNWKKQKGFKVTTVSTSATGTSTGSIKTYIQNLYNNINERPDYVTLIGDVSGTFGIPTYSETYANGCPAGSGDAPYSHLAGGSEDFLGDVFIGRMSISSISDFQTMVSKVLLYEKNPTIVGTDWLRKNVVCAETSPSGNSTISVGNYTIETIRNYDPLATFTFLQPEPSLTDMTNAANQGALFFTYRGYIGQNGLSSANMSSFTNDKKLFASLNITCATGAFSGDSYIENITRTGTPSAPKGAIIAVGMSTSHTLTPYNNLLIGSMIHGHFVDEIPSAGGFVQFARINLIQTYSGDATNHSKTLAQWMNLMGDPSVYIYRSVPKTFNVQHSSTLQLGQNFLTVVVKDEENNPVPNAWVSLVNSQYESLAFLMTDDSGVVTLPTPNSFEGNLFLTVSEKDFKSYITTITQDTNGLVAFDNKTINDAVNGNNNQQVNPGETITYSITVKNTSGSSASNVNLTLRTQNPYISITDSTAVITAIDNNSTANATDAFTFTVASDYPANLPLDFVLNAQSGTQNWNSMIFEQVKAVDIDVQGITVVNANHVIELGQPANIYFDFKNNGQIPAQNVNVRLKSKSLFLQVSDSTAVLGSFENGATINNAGDPFTLTALAGIFPGVNLKAELIFTNNQGYTETEEIMIRVGNVTTHDPVPPDPYGYVIYDVTDTTYSDAPVYDWQEISTTGTALSLTDSGENTDTSTTINLPFNFKMYGQSYNQLTVCTNGWASAVPTNQIDFRPLTLPNAVAPRAIIAPYWHDLAISGTGSHVYTYYDETNHCFIIQWNNMKLVKNDLGSYTVTGNNVTFQAILYDPAFLATPLGDSPIKFQYKEFHIGLPNEELESLQNYFVAGIQDHTAQIGTTYCFNNHYYQGAAQLGNNTALFITHPFFLNEAPYIMNSSPILHDQNANNIIEAGESLNIGLPLVNVGLMTATNVHANLVINDPYVTLTTPQANYINIPPSGNAINTDYFTLQISPDCPNNHTVNVDAHVVSDQAEWNRGFNFTVYKPQLAYRSYLINDSQGNNNGILEAGETVKLLVNINNASDLEINNVHTQIFTANQNLTITDNSSDVQIMRGNTNYQNVFELTLSSSVTQQTSIPLQVSVNSDNAPNLTFELQLGVNQSGALLQESFDQGLPQGWIIQYQSSHWSFPQTNEAGGTAPEVKFVGTPAFTGRSQLVSKTLDTTDISSVVLSFKQKINVSGSGATIGVATRSAFQSWHVVWSEDVSASVPAQIKNIPINNSDLGRQNFQICWFIDGNTANFNDWFIDDVTVQTNVGNTALLNGNLSIDDPDFDLRNVTVKAGEYSACPDSTGSYSLYLIPGTYAFINAEAPYTLSNNVTNVQLNAGQVMNDVNFNMHYYMNPRNLSYQMNSETRQVQLNWSYQLPDNTPLSFVSFSIYRQTNTGEFTQIINTTENTFNETLDPANRYRYFVKALYATGSSDSSNVIYVNPNITGNDPIDNTPVNFGLKQNYPNPFNPTTNIAFSLSKDSNVNLNIYNVKGQLVKTLKNEKMLKGNHSVQWNGVNNNNKAVGSGIYFIRLQAGNQHSVKKALLLK
jgi:hypothetical protein